MPLFHHESFRRIEHFPGLCCQATSRVSENGENIDRLPKKKFEEQLAALETLRESAGAPATVDSLRKALANRNNYVAAKASKITVELGLKSLLPDLLSAFDRFFIDPVKSDPQCWAKNALVQALAALGHDESAVFIRGLRHIQMEPVWGGQEDTAAALRGNCALALVACRDL